MLEKSHKSDPEADRAEVDSTQHCHTAAAKPFSHIPGPHRPYTPARYRKPNCHLAANGNNITSESHGNTSSSSGLWLLYNCWLFLVVAA